MLNDFIEWANSVTAGQVAGMMDAQVTLSEASNHRSARLDVDTPAAVARITCWESGDYEAEIIDLESERQIYARHGMLQAGEILSQQFQTFFEALGVGQK
jgi:hypothetical protein